MNQQLLKNKDIFPTNEVLKDSLKDIYSIFFKFENIIKKDPYNLELNWNYYNDGKAWLCKVTFKKKTIFWLSIWEGFFKTSFFFTEKNELGINDLQIDQLLKDNYFSTKLTGKLRALIVDIKNEKDVENILEIIKYKKGLK